MADKDTLRDLLVAQGIGDEAAVADYVSSIDAVEAKRLVDLIMSGQGGQTLNLEGGKGGFLAGVRNILEARRADAELTLPPKPYTVDRETKAAAKEAFASQIESGNESFVDGLKLILENRRVEQIGSLAIWQGELDDEDFASHVGAADEELARSNAAVIAAVQETLEAQARSTRDLLDKHRDAADG